MSEYNPFSLEGKTVLVTGASSGIGQATAIECSKMGATMIITGRNEERLNETFQKLDGQDRAHRQITADLLQEAEMDALVSQVGDFNGVVFCAGRTIALPFTYCTRDKYNEIFDVNFFSTVELLRLFYKQKKISKKGSVVFISSIGGTRLFKLGQAAYGASKAALSATSKICAKEFAKREIRVNAVVPGMVNTPLIASGTFTEEQYQEDLKLYPLKRYGEPNDIAYGIIYLLSDASSWVTGTTLVIDGGCSM